MGGWEQACENRGSDGRAGERQGGSGEKDGRGGRWAGEQVVDEGWRGEQGTAGNAGAETSREKLSESLFWIVVLSCLKASWRPVASLRDDDARDDDGSGQGASR